MNNNNALQQILDKFEYIDLEKVYEKIKQFKIGGKGLLHVVSDFDHTLTAGKTAASISNSWGAIDSLLPKEAVRKHQEYYSELRPLEISGRLTNDFAAEYWTKVLDLITSYPLQEKDLKDAFLSSAKLRSGVVETFSLCERNNVPVIILSSGIRNIIDEVFDYYGVKPDYVFSNKLVVDENGMINSWDRDSLIHIKNKREAGHRELLLLKTERPNKLLLGDVPHDTDMVEGDDALRICLVDARKKDNVHKDEIIKNNIEAGYDLIVDQDLSPVANLLDYLAE